MAGLEIKCWSNNDQPHISINCSVSETVGLRIFLNQARAGHRPVRAWFLKIDPVRTSVCVFVCVFVCVCVSAPEAINN